MNYNNKRSRDGSTLGLLALAEIGAGALYAGYHYRKGTLGTAGNNLLKATRNLAAVGLVGAAVLGSYHAYNDGVAKVPEKLVQDGKYVAQIIERGVEGTFSTLGTIGNEVYQTLPSVGMPKFGSRNGILVDNGSVARSGDHTGNAYILTGPQSPSVGASDLTTGTYGTRVDRGSALLEGKTNGNIIFDSRGNGTLDLIINDVGVEGRITSGPASRVSSAPAPYVGASPRVAPAPYVGPSPRAEIELPSTEAPAPGTPSPSADYESEEVAPSAPPAHGKRSHEGHVRPEGAVIEG